MMMTFVQGKWKGFPASIAKAVVHMGVVRNAWKEAVEKLKVLEAGKCG